MNTASRRSSITAMMSRLTRMDAKGISLVELLVSLGVGAIAMAAVISMFTTLTRSYTTQSVSADVQQASRAALDYMVQNIRMAGFNPGRIDNVGILAASSNRIQFNLDRNENRAIDFVDEEHMTYAYDPVEQEIDEGLYVDDDEHRSWNLLVDNVADLTFTYRDSAGRDLGPAPAPADIRIVDILLTVAQRVPQNETPVSRTYSARIICRNLVLQ